MASGQRALTAVGRGDPLLERQFNLIKLDSRYVLFFFTSKLLDSCYTVEKKQKYVGLPLRSFPFFDVSRSRRNWSCSSSQANEYSGLIQDINTPHSTNIPWSLFQGGRRTGQEQSDTTKPVTISEEEELERITSLLQRDNLIRGLGVVEFVYKLLHCTPGTGGPQKNCSLHHSVSYKKIAAY